MSALGVATCPITSRLEICLLVLPVAQHRHEGRTEHADKRVARQIGELGIDLSQPLARGRVLLVRVRGLGLRLAAKLGDKQPDMVFGQRMNFQDRKCCARCP